MSLRGRLSPLYMPNSQRCGTMIVELLLQAKVGSWNGSWMWKLGIILWRRMTKEKKKKSEMLYHIRTTFVNTQTMPQRKYEFRNQQHPSIENFSLRFIFSCVKLYSLCQYTFNTIAFSSYVPLESHIVWCPLMRAGVRRTCTTASTIDTYSERE